ncbi:MAG TPA: tRNA-dihydrouridine synthase [Candidatus Paceibacterota bacterium]
MVDFWKTLTGPFFVQAPLEDVTDAAFRRLIAEYGKPDVMFTEFTSADGLVLSSGNGRKKIEKKLLYNESERPIVAQLFSAVPSHMEYASCVVRDLGFDGIDINMGCPDRAVERGGCGAALMKNPKLARELIRSAKKSGLPVSVKTRIGYNEDELDTWLPELCAEELSAVSIHARTRKEMSDVPARWDVIARAVQLRDRRGASTRIIGNGDVKDVNDARAKARESGCDGVMLGRALFGTPWLFAHETYIPNPKEKLTALLRHLELFETLLSGTTHYAVMKKHYKAYVSGWDGAKELRIALMETSDADSARSLVTKYCNSL